MNPIFKIIILNGFWYAAVYFGPVGKTFEYLIFVAGIFLAVSNYFQSKTEMPFKNYLALLLGFFLFGFCQDYFLGSMGYINYKQAYPPLWLLSMYAAFLCYYDDLFLKFRKMHIGIQIAFGAIGGPLAYVGGSAIAELKIPAESKMMYIILVGISWAAFFPISLIAYREMEQG
jgi:hypothetical protein